MDVLSISLSRTFNCTLSRSLGVLIAVLLAAPLAYGGGCDVHLAPLADSGRCNAPPPEISKGKNVPNWEKMFRI